MALATAACLLVGLVTTLALWPGSTPAPRLSLTSEVGGTDAQASGMNTDPTTSDPLTFGERWAYVKPPEKPWAIWRDVRGYGHANAPQPEPRLSRWETKAACEVARAEYVEQLYQQIATQPPGVVMMKRLADGRIQQTWGGMAGHPPPIISFLCLKPDGQPS